jgi:hypothetical protein
LFLGVCIMAQLHRWTLQSDEFTRHFPATQLKHGGGSGPFSEAWRTASALATCSIYTMRTARRRAWEETDIDKNLAGGVLALSVPHRPGVVCNVGTHPQTRLVMVSEVVAELSRFPVKGVQSMMFSFSQLRAKCTYPEIPNLALRRQRFCNTPR